MQQVEQIKAELEKTLVEMEEVLKTLEQVDREKSFLEKEVEQLRETLRSMYREREREPGSTRFQRQGGQQPRYQQRPESSSHGSHSGQSVHSAPQHHEGETHSTSPAAQHTQPESAEPAETDSGSEGDGPTTEDRY
jgi:regulator of replication initiation timing